MILLNRKKSVFIVMASIVALNCYAQPVFRKYEFGASLAAFVYQGDLTPERLGSFRTMRPGINLFVNRILSASTAIRTNLAIGGLRGDDSKYSEPAFRQQRNFAFRTPVIELSGSMVYNPLGRNYTDKGLTPYFLGGIGLSYLRIRRDASRFNAEYFATAHEVLDGLAADERESLPHLALVLPVGMGLGFGITHTLSLNVEAAYRFSFTDYLDGFSKAANPSLNDHYTTYSIGLVYRPGWKNRLNCPTVYR